MLNVKQGKAFNDKMLINMSKKKLSTVDLQDDLLVSDQKPVNAVSKHSLAVRKESTKMMVLEGAIASPRGSSIGYQGQMINNPSGLD